MEVAVAVDVPDDPSVPVHDPEPVAAAKGAVVVPRDDDVPGAGASTVAERDLSAGTRRQVGEPVGAGLLVEVADRVPARSEEQARPAGRDVGSPGVERLVCGGAAPTHVDASLREIVFQRGRVAAANTQRPPRGPARCPAR